jgi:hypothetical protein
MKILQLVLFTGLCFFTSNILEAQVKIGDDPLNIGDDRWLEIKRTGVDEFLLVTDSLYFGRSNSANTNLSTDALMLKLYGYGLGLPSFLPTSAGQQASTALGNIFLAPSINGEVLEVPLGLSLVIADTTQADLSITNGIDTFGTINLLLLDSIFATNNELRDSTNILRTLIANSESSDGDTLTRNEYIDTIFVDGDTMLIFRENVANEMGTMNEQQVDLSPVIGAKTFYLADGTLDENRTVDGDNNNLTFTNLDSAEIEANFITIDGDQVSIQQDGQDIIMINANEEVKFRSTTTDSILFIDDDGTLVASDYGTGANNTGLHTYILGVQEDGTIVDVDIADILATQVDSTIYNNDGSLTGDRVLDGDNFDMTFTDINALVDSSVTSLSTTTGTNTVESTGSDVLIGASAGDINLTTTDVHLNGTETVDINSPLVTLSDSLRLEGYGENMFRGTLTTILGVDSLGNVIELTASEILAFDLDSTIYNSNGSLTGDRVLDGDNFDMTFTDINALVDSSVTSLSTTTGTNTVESTGSDVLIGASAGTVDINSPLVTLSDSLRLEGYGDTLYRGTLRTILGVDSLGNVIELTASEILASDLDSTIYNSNGTLTGERYMTMDGNDLHFVGGTAVGDTTIIHDDGTISIGRSTVRQNADNMVKLDVEGDIYARQVHSSSDRRFKKNIKNVDSALDKVMHINGVTYNFRTEEFADRHFSSREQLGFIAQNLEEVIPQVVTTADDGYKAVDYAKITALLNEAIKEQQGLILNLQSQLAQSENNNLKMVKEMADIKDMLKSLMKSSSSSQTTEE